VRGGHGVEERLDPLDELFVAFRPVRIQRVRGRFESVRDTGLAKAVAFAAAMAAASCQGPQIGTTSGRENSASSRVEGGGCRRLTEESVQFNDWNVARATLCRPSDEWPWKVAATEACGGYRLLTLSEVDSSTEYFFARGSGILVGVAHHYATWPAARRCFGEVPAIRVESCPSRVECSDAPP
jgi:hypothetical protein